MAERSPDPRPDEWDAVASSWDDDEAARAYAKAAFTSLQAAIVGLGATLDGIAVCDFGCGTGLLTERLAPTAGRIDAVDRSPAMLEVLRAKIERMGWTNVRIHLDIDSGTGPYDLIVCSSVCSFLDDYPGTVERLTQQLAPGGVFVQWDWERDPSDDGSHGLTRSEIHQALVASGLASVSVETGFLVTVDDATMSPLMGTGRTRARPARG